MPKPKPKIDYIFLFSTLALLAVGTIMVFSASPTMGLKLGDTFYFIKRHIFYLLLGFAAMFLGAKTDLEWLKKWSAAVFVFSVFLLLLVYIPGVGRRVLGAARWIDLGILSFQPSEFAKFAVVLFLANLLANMKDKIEDFWRGLFPLLCVVGVIAAIILKQPDMGTALTIAGTAFVLFVIAGARMLHLFALGGMGFVGALILSLTSAYRFRRITAYLNPWQDPQGSGFQVIQSLLAVGSGGLFGLGLGASRQKYFYLPQQFTDFIFAILCEELGFIGAILVVILFAVFAVRGFRIAASAGDKFCFYLAAGIVSWFTLQALINMMVVVGLIPTTGIPLPFISYGGTATVMELFSVGILLKTAKDKK